MTNITLNKEDFESLVQGKIIKKGADQILLKDIGLDIMRNAINEQDQSIIYLKNPLKQFFKQLFCIHRFKVDKKSVMLPSVPDCKVCTKCEVLKKM